jgi:hypothetical protein
MICTVKVVHHAILYIANAAVLLYYVVIMQIEPFAVPVRGVSDIACVPHTNQYSVADESLGSCHLK